MVDAGSNIGRFGPGQGRPRRGGAWRRAESLTGSSSSSSSLSRSLARSLALVEPAQGSLLRRHTRPSPLVCYSRSSRARRSESRGITAGVESLLAPFHTCLVSSEARQIEETGRREGGGEREGREGKGRERARDRGKGERGHDGHIYVQVACDVVWRQGGEDFGARPG